MMCIDIYSQVQMARTVYSGDSLDNSQVNGMVETLSGGAQRHSLATQPAKLGRQRRTGHCRSRSQHAWVRDAARGWCLAICGLEGGCDRARGVEVRLRRMGAVRQAHGGRKRKGAAILLACTSDNVTWAWSRGRRNLARREGSL